MVVDHADRLHEGIDDGRPDEFEAVAEKFLGHRPRFIGFGRRPRAAAEFVVDRLAADVRPKHVGKSRPAFHDLEPCARRADRAFDLGAVAHDAGVLHQPLDLLRRVARDLLRLEIVEGAAEIFALAQDGDPRQPGLEAVEHELLEQRAVVPFRHAPFLVVIGDVERVLLRPRAALQPVGVNDGGAHDCCLLARPGKARPIRLRQFDAQVAAQKRRAGGERIGDAVEPHAAPSRGP